MSQDIRDNYIEVRERMETACKLAGRDSADVRLVAVSKYVPVERMQQAYDLGIRHFGENHAQELHQKQTFFEQEGCKPHFIGHLQTNKLKYLCGYAAMVESVDRLSLVEAMENRCAKLEIVADVLIQINIGAEPQKSGVLPDGLAKLAQAVVDCSNLRLRGVMCVPPAVPANEARFYFAKTRELFAGLRNTYPKERIDTLSMGMSHDYEAAILEGATQVRIGSALFGARSQV